MIAHIDTTAETALTPLDEEKARYTRLVNSLDGLVRNGMVDEALDRFDVLMERLIKANIDRLAKDQLIAEAKHYAFEASCLKVEDLIFVALHHARAGEDGPKRLTIRQAEVLLKKAARWDPTKSAMVSELEKRLDLAKETEAAGVSEQAKNQTEEGWSVAAFSGEKRRFLRYGDPVFTVEVGTGHPLQSIDFSLIGLRVAGGNEHLRLGHVVSIKVSLVEGSSIPSYKGSAVVVRISESVEGSQPSFALRFTSTDGPIMYFIRHRAVDLSTLPPL